MCIYTHIYTKQSPPAAGLRCSGCPVWTPVSPSCCHWDVWAPRVQPPSSCWCRLSHTQSFPGFPSPQQPRSHPFCTLGSFPKHPIVSRVQCQNAHPLHPIMCPTTRGSDTSNPKGNYLGSLPCPCLHGSFLWVYRQAFINKLTLL